MASKPDYLLATKIQKEMAGETFNPQFARLYSQHTRLQNNQPSLSSWRSEEAEQRLNDALALIEVGFIFLEEKELAKAQDSFKRAAEVIEWLSHSKIFESTFSLSILSSALYQLAGFPSRASTILVTEKTENAASLVLHSFLRSDFTGLMRTLGNYWRQQHVVTDPDELVVLETIRSLAIIQAHIRWGGETERLQKAKEKIKSASLLMSYNNSFFSWVLAKLTSHISEAYESRSMRKSVSQLNQLVSEDGKKAFERYLRYNYLLNKSLIWPSQEAGLEKLIQGKSFVLCTPTGSGKTTVAELAIIKSLFENQDEDAVAPLILYLTPSRALATEVENKLSKVLKTIDRDIVVTGLYGGTDWGPTDAWLTNESKTVLICTYEKAEALLRFLGPLFVHRISLAIVDEVHGVQFDGGGQMSSAIDSRAFRLESLITRLLTHVDSERVKIIGLSAVAAEIETPLAKWLESDDQATPAKTKYRSTRQILGKLEVANNGGFKISYDLLDSNRLFFDERNQQEGPYVVDPIPADPTPGDWKAGNPSDETKLRCSLFWAALHLASKSSDTGQYRSVLISITQLIGGYAEDLLSLLENHWADKNLPDFFSEPTEPTKRSIWIKSLAACEDYFGVHSREYRLLQKGIVVHHGKMPGTMARLLVLLIEQKVVNVVLATSTLSEGVNLPFETVLVPTIRRMGQLMPVREFANLMGRAGRPGVGTEGRTLVILPRLTRTTAYPHRLYEELVTQLTAKDAHAEDKVNSALLALLNLINDKWHEAFPDLDDSDFVSWLEEAVPEYEEDEEQDDESAEQVLNKSLDSLDGFLLSSLVEIEKLNGIELSQTDWEQKLKVIWKKSFAYSSQGAMSSLEDILLQRGQALKSNLYQDTAERRKIYCTSLPPKAGKGVLDLYSEVIAHLKTGSAYSQWDSNERFDYIRRLTELLSKHGRFRLKAKVGKSKSVKPHHVLRWWLDPRSADQTPTEKQITDWFNYISKNYLYKFNWGLGSILALVMHDLHEGELQETKIEHWESTGLPWIVFWLKELVTWGTLDPVTAFLLSRGSFTTRSEAELFAANYYVDNSLLLDSDTDEIYDARKIRDWADENVERLQPKATPNVPQTISVTLERDFSKALNKTFKVIPVIESQTITWFDIAGYPLAKSKLEFEWLENMIVTYDFVLHPKSKKVVSSLYMDVT